MDEDESWFSRFEQPTLQAWSDREPLHMVQRIAPEPEADKALACYGAVRSDTQQVYFSFSALRPISEETWKFVQALVQVAREEGKHVLVIIWDNASWHLSKRLRQWVRQYNHEAKTSGDVRILTHLLPLQSPWLNPIEPRWVHAKRAICEPNGTLLVEEARRRLCAYFGSQPLSSFTPNLH